MIDAALEVWSLFDAIDRLYVGPAPCAMCSYQEHVPTTLDGIAASDVLKRAAGQVRAVKAVSTRSISGRF